MLTYEELPADEFRLLTIKPLSYVPPVPRPLHPSLDPVQVYGTLKTLRREDPIPIYTTLSYVWGHSSPKKYICVNDDLLSVGPDLETALRYLRLPDEELVIWVDAVCINQEQDSKERAAHVRRIRSIYANSVKTIAWLGEPVGEGGICTDMCIEALDEIGEKVEALDVLAAIITLAKRPSTEEGEFYEKMRVDINERLEGLYLKEDGMKLRSLMTGFRHIAKLPYWTRTWTQQEFAVANDIEIALGRARISLERFHAGVLFMPWWQRRMLNFSEEAFQRGDSLDFMYWMENFFQPLPSALDQPIGLRMRYQHHHEEPNTGLLNVLCRAHIPLDADPRCSCTLSVDKIFGLLGVSSDGLMLDIEVNYDPPTETVYTDVARALIEAGNVDVLAYCQFDPLRTQDVSLEDGELVYKLVNGNTLPSWVPDW